MSATPFDDLEPHAVLSAKDIADRLHIDPRSVRRAVARDRGGAGREAGAGAGSGRAALSAAPAF